MSKLIDNEVEQIQNFLEDNKSEQVKEMEEIIANVEVNPDAPLEEEDVHVTTNDLGMPIDIQADIEEESTDIYADLFADAGIKEEIDFETEEVKDELIVKAIKEILDISTTDAKKTLEVIKEYRALSKEEKEEFSAFIKLPESIRRQINRMTGGSKTHRNDIAKSFIDQIIREAIFDNEITKVQDLMGSVAKELDISNTIDMYSKYQKGLMEDNLRKHAEKLREEGQTDKADQLDKISDAYHQSYTLEVLIKDINEYGGKYKIKNIEMEKIDSRVFDSFNSKYIESEFTIPDIKEAFAIALSKFIDYDEKDIKKFFIVFCKYCKDFVPENIEQHTFMYYTLMNIITLNFEDVDADNEFAKSIRKSVSNVIEIIKEKYK